MVIIPERKIYEKTLVTPIIDLFERQGYIVFTEQYVGFRRADVLAVKVNNVEVRKRVSHGVKHIPPRVFFRIIRLLDRYGELSIEELADKLGYTTKYISSVVSTVNPLYLHRKKGRVRKLHPYTSYVDEMIGVEIKVKDWKYGLVQAHQYLYAVDKSYLAIYYETLEEIPNNVLDWIKNKGLGLITIDDKLRVKELIKAEKSGPLSKTAYYSLAEELWSKVLKILNHLSM